jgi:hypothetical protein
MEETKHIYKARFEIGTSVQIAEREFLENFLHNWKLHDKLEPEQLNYHGQVATVEKVGFYFGGDQLYKLIGIPGIWHEQCLKAVAPVL